MVDLVILELEAAFEKNGCEACGMRQRREVCGAKHSTTNCREPRAACHLLLVANRKPHAARHTP